MCGIYSFFSFLDEKISIQQRNELFRNFAKSQHRGPDNSVFKNINEHSIIGFHRLAIMDIIGGDQPFIENQCYLICNGEIYNHNQLITEHNLITNSNSDCEVIIHLYLKYGIEKTIQLLDGVFAFILYDQDSETIYAGRDPIGVRSLYYSYTNEQLALSSELKSIPYNNTQFFPPGYYMTFHDKKMIFTKYTNSWVYIEDEYHEVKKNLTYLFERAVKKRLMSDRPIGCLLSGGFDSSIVAALVARNYEPYTIHTFSIGMEGATDLKYAKIVADHIKSIHHEIIVTEQQMLDAIPRVVKSIESWDTTTVRASTPMILLCDYIKQNTDITVVYSGEGSDEASGSYMYFYNAPNLSEFRNETERLVEDLQYFDVLRCDKSISAAGLEARVPFLDQDFLYYYMSIPSRFKFPRSDFKEKHLLRDCFSEQNLLPDEVLWRQKEAFSDGCSKKEKSWSTIIQKYCDTMKFSDSLNTLKHPPVLNESKYYRTLFLEEYPENDRIIPYYWLPKWSGDVIDPSARVLDVYNQ